MTDKERLEEIEKNLDPLGYGMGGHLISVNDIHWLVKYAKEQAERVQELEELVEGYKIELMIKDNAKKRANQQNKRYRKAINECVERMNAGGAGTRSFVYETLKKALEGTK